MSINELIAEAREKDGTFKRKYDYWLKTKRQKPDFDWLMKLLEDALGVQYVRDAANSYLDSLYDPKEEPRGEEVDSDGDGEPDTEGDSATA